MSKPKSSVIAVRVVGPLAPYSWQFASLLAERGYTPLSRVNQLRAVGHLSKWLSSVGLDVGVLTFERVNAYLAQRRVEGYSSFCSRASLKQLSDLLAGCAAPLVEPMVPGSEVGALLAGLPVARGRSVGWRHRRRPRMCCGHGALSSDMATAPIWAAAM